MNTKYSEINFSGTDAHLRDMLHERNLYVPTDDNNKLSRKAAIRLLTDWDTQYSKVTDKKVKVIFHKSMNPSAGPYVFASINGENFQAPYETPVVIQERFLRNCIDNAKTIHERHSTDEFNRPCVIKDTIPTYPYSVIGYVTDEEAVEDTVE